MYNLARQGKNMVNRTSKNNLGKKIKTLRLRLEITQEQLSKKIGADIRQISMYENNKIIPSTQVLVRLSEVFGVTLDYLVRDNAEEQFIPKINDPEILSQFEKIDKLDKDSRYVIQRVVNAILLEKNLSSIIVQPAR